MRFGTARTLAALGFALVLVLPAGAAARARRGGDPGPGATPIRGVPLPPDLLAIGARDSSTAATVVHCTNANPHDIHVYVEIVEYDGSLDCFLDFTAAHGETWTVASRDTAFYAEDKICTAPPGTAQGLVIVKATIEDDLFCTVQVIDPSSATPAYLTTLTLYDGDANPISAWIFKDSFERGDTYRWSSTAAGAL